MRLTRGISLRSCAIALSVVTAVWAPSAAGQSGTTIGFGLGPLHDYPREFGGTGCEGDFMGAHVAARRSISGAFSIEAAIDWTGSVRTECAADALLRPPPLDGETYTRTTFDDALRGETFFASRLGVVATPWHNDLVIPSVRLSAGRLWAKDLWTWTWGAGLRIGTGRFGFVMDAERWNLGYDVVHERWTFRQNDLDVLESREVRRRTPRPWFVRMGVEMTLGG